MKFTKIEVFNFKPYNEKKEIMLYDIKRQDKSITINVGPNEHGKTSISEMIFWCLFGENCPSGKTWEDWVNDLATKIAIESGKNEINMYVKLYLQNENQEYMIFRSGLIYAEDLENRKRKEESKLKIFKNGKEIENDPKDFILSNFLNVDLMDYFIFDADRLLQTFEEDQTSTIKDYINRILRVDTLDRSKEALQSVIKIYNNEITDIETNIESNISDLIKANKSDIKIKESRIQVLVSENSKFLDEQNEIFSSNPSEQIRKFSKLVDKKDAIKKEIKKTNEKFLLDKNEDINRQFFLILLEDIIEDTIDKLADKTLSKDEFLTNLELLKTTIGEDYIGILVGDPDFKLINKNQDIDPKNLASLNKIKFTDESYGNLFDEYAVFQKYKAVMLQAKKNFNKYYSKISKLKERLSGVEKEIKTLGESEQKKDDKKKIDAYDSLDKRIKDNNLLINEINGKIKEQNKKNDELKKELEYNEEQKVVVSFIKLKIKKTKKLLDIMDKIKEVFMDELLSKINHRASELLRKIVKGKRFHNIEVSANYDFVIKTRSDQILKSTQINRATTQIALMSFFIALSEHFGKKIPYIIDAPIIRLDGGNDRRLITELAKNKEQLILHLIPDREYTPKVFNWINPYLNIQNWIDREPYSSFDEEISTVEIKDSTMIIDYDIE